MDIYQVTSPAPRECWKQFADSDEHTLVFQTPIWMDGACKTGEYVDASRMYQTRDGRTIVLPLARRKNTHPWLATLASMPNGWGMGGPISDEPIRVGDIEMILADIARQPALQAYIRPNPLTTHMWEAACKSGFTGERRYTHILDLDGGFEQVWSQRFSSATRNKIRKAEKSGVTVECGTGGQYLPELYTVYMQWINRRAAERHVPGPIARWLGRYREPKDKFQIVASQLGKAFQVWIARKNGQPIAAAVLLLHGKNAHYWRSASVKELAGPTRANDLLQLRMIEAACLAGCRYYHMGESGGVRIAQAF